MELNCQTETRLLHFSSVLVTSCVLLFCPQVYSKPAVNKYYGANTVILGIWGEPVS